MVAGLMISVRNLHKRYGEQTVLDGVSFDIARGSVSTIIGRSGGGKSVLLKHLIGLEKPDSGEIVIDGINLVGIAPAQLNKLRMRFGVLFQGGALFDSLSVRENVAFPLREHTRLSEKEIQDQVMSLLAMVELADHAEKFPSQISGGMQKRVGLARALALDPDIVFFDEPTSGLDPLTRSSIYALIDRTHKERSATYVMVSHDIRGVFAISQQLMMLWGGKIVARGTPDEMKRNADPVVRQFITGSLFGPVGGEHSKRMAT